jgi:FixJ family two-component response regulator
MGQRVAEPARQHHPVLLVDEDHALLGAVTAKLTNAGYPVMAVSSTAEALAGLYLARPGTVFLSARVAMWASFPLVQELQAAPGRPCVLLTGQGAAYNWRPLGADGFLNAPVNGRRLLGHLDRWNAATHAA